MKKLLTTSILSVMISLGGVFAQTSINEQNGEGGEYPVGRNDATHPCITPAQYKIIEQQNIANCKMLGIPYGMQKGVAMTTTFSWPVKMVNGLNDCSYYYIGNYVDQDTTSPGIKDWNCGTVTYDGHKGTDICTYPYPFYKMDNNQVEVIAAAPGTIVNKVDGNYDRNCALNDSLGNYINIEHADGSVAMYFHMKKNSLTSKTIGQTVITGEYLGIVGSSGDASGPHLHFEVLSTMNINSLVDPFAGTCNTLNANSLWVSQKPYTEPAIIQASVHPVLAVFPACPATETPNEDSCYTGGGTAKFYIFYRNETATMVANMSIVNPNGTTFSSWSHTSVNSYLSSYRLFTETLPTATGTYTFEAVYNGDTCRRSFMINCGTVGIVDISDLQLQVYPNPVSDYLQIQTALSVKKVDITDITGRLMYTTTSKSINCSTFAKGVYIIRTLTEKGIIVMKFVKE